MSRWFRVYDDIINDPKVLKLPEESRWHWIAMLCIASKNGGVLPSTEDVAISLRVKTPAAAAIIATLKAASLLDLVEGRYVPHNWDGRQFKSDVSTERVKRFRNARRNVSDDVAETVTETPRSVSVSDSVSVPSSKKEESDFEFEDFWNLWPNKVGKPAALKAFVSARKRAGLDAIVEGVFAYIRDKPPDRPWLNPATFLNQNRWEDQPAQVAHGRNEKTQSLSHIARRHAEQGISFGERPASPSARLNAGIANVRLLPQGGGERPGDLRSGDGVGPERISAGSDRLRHGPEDGIAEQITVVAERIRG